jgi:hypothetical protein
MPAKAFKNDAEATFASAGRFVRPDGIGRVAASKKL